MRDALFVGGVIGAAEIVFMRKAYVFTFVTQMLFFDSTSKRWQTR
jgi:hypothetical protein